MQLIVGLGNPGKKYEQNRHNIGARIVKHWINRKKLKLQLSTKFNAEYAMCSIGEEKVLAILPLTYMNLSGDSVIAAMNFYKIPMENVLVLHDEVDIPATSFRIKKGGGAGGHNGLHSINVHGTNYQRIRLGIGRPSNLEMPLSSFVLGNFEEEEKLAWEKIYPSVEESIHLCISGKIEEAMNKFNRKN